MRTAFLLSILLGVGLAANEEIAAQPVAIETNPSETNPLALPPPRDADQTSASQSPIGGLGSLVNTLGALALVVGCFLLVAWFLKRSGAGADNGQASGAVQLIARTDIGGGQHASVVRFGNQLLLVAQSSGQSQTLATITDADEVERICDLCQSEPSPTTNGASALSSVIASFMNRPAVTQPQS